MDENSKDGRFAAELAQLEEGCEQEMAAQAGARLGLAEEAYLVWLNRPLGLEAGAAETGLSLNELEEARLGYLQEFDEPMPLTWHGWHRALQVQQEYLADQVY